MATHFRLAGVPLPTPQAFKIEDYNLTDSQRLLNGEMVMSFIATKRKFYLTYDCLTGQQVEVFRNLLCTGTCFFTLEYEENGIWKSATVYSGSLTKTLARAAKGGSWIWKDVEIHLIER